MEKWIFIALFHFQDPAPDSEYGSGIQPGNLNPEPPGSETLATGTVPTWGFPGEVGQPPPWSRGRCPTLWNCSLATCSNYQLVKTINQWFGSAFILCESGSSIIERCGSGSGKKKTFVPRLSFLSISFNRFLNSEIGETCLVIWLNMIWQLQPLSSFWLLPII